MSKGWYGNRQAHSLASRGILTSKGYWGGESDELKEARRKSRKSKLAIDWLDDIHNIHIDKLHYYDIPYDVLLDEDDWHKYSKSGYQLTIGERDNHPEHYDYAYTISPTFDTPEELNDWWIENKQVVVGKINSSRMAELEDWFENELGSGEEYPSYESLYQMSEMFEKLVDRKENDNYVTVYHASQGYGGAEEGGWWYSTEDPLYTIKLKTYDEALEWNEKLSSKYQRTNKRYNVNGGEDFNVRIGRSMPSYSPDSKPRYS